MMPAEGVQRQPCLPNPTPPPVSTEHTAAGFSSVIAFVEELARAGVKHVCIAPGSRSTPLALALAEHPGLEVWMHVDERSTGFFALGMAKALQQVVAVLCTSGTAAANLLPAAVEAHASSVSLLLMTADRPPELHDVGATQTIDQHRLFGGFAKWFVNVELQAASPVMLRYARSLAGRAVATARAVPAGPVHLNFPFREPLTPLPHELASMNGGEDTAASAGIPGSEYADATAGGSAAENARESGRDTPWVTVHDALPTLSPATVRTIADALLASRNPMIVCGPQPDARLSRPLAELASALQAPLLADPLSQLRWGPHERSAIIDRYDTFLRHADTAGRFTPDLVIRFGSTPTSKTLLQFLEHCSSARVMIVDPARWPDPTLMAADILHSDPALLASALLEEVQRSAAVRESRWLAAWKQADVATGTALHCYTQSLSENFEGRVLFEVASMLPDAGTLFVSNSMPVRDLDAFAPGSERRTRVLGNRGANGIDGVVSTALGVSAASRVSGDGPVVLVIGDLAFYHDMNGLLAAMQHHLDVTIVVVNNDGGGIFSFLPQADYPQHFEKLFGTPLGLRFALAAEMYGAKYTLANDVAELRSGLQNGLESGGLHIVEVQTERNRNVQLHRDAYAAVFAALEDLAHAGGENGAVMNAGSIVAGTEVLDTTPRARAGKPEADAEALEAVEADRLE